MYKDIFDLMGDLGKGKFMLHWISRGKTYIKNVKGINNYAGKLATSCRAVPSFH